MSRRRTNPALQPMQWAPEMAGSMLSNRGYRITLQPMARGAWCNAYAPYGGQPLASGQLERCVHACEAHHAEIRSRGKRWAKVPMRMQPQL